MLLTKYLMPKQRRMTVIALCVGMFSDGFQYVTVEKYPEKVQWSWIIHPSLLEDADLPVLTVQSGGTYSTGASSSRKGWLVPVVYRLSQNTARSCRKAAT
jgi:hypothetical protein